MKPLPVQPRFLRANVSSRPVGIDREKGIIYGVIAAEEGPFKTPGRGEFDREGIRQIARMMKEKPLKSRFAHPTLSDDGIGKFLGRFHNARNDVVERIVARGKDGSATKKEFAVVRADIHLDPTSFKTPSGDLGTYVMDLAESDHEAFGTSLVIEPEEKVRLDAKGFRMRDEEGVELPPLWFPKSLHALDVVDTGDATNSFLGHEIDGLPDAIVRRGAELLDGAFAGQSREVVEARCQAWLDRYLNLRYGLSEVVKIEVAPVVLVESQPIVSLAEHLVAETEPPWGRVDQLRLPREAFAGQGVPETRSSWLYAHHWVAHPEKIDSLGVYAGGILYLHKEGLESAWKLANERKAPSEVIEHLLEHRNRMNLLQKTS